MTRSQTQREELDFGTLTLPPAIYLTGRVTDERGVPVVGTPVSLGGAQDDRYRFHEKAPQVKDRPAIVEKR